MCNFFEKFNLLNSSTEEKVGKLPIAMQYLIHVLLDCVDLVIKGKCDEEVLVDTLSTIYNNSNGKYGKDDLMYYDEVGKLLGFGTTNRVGLKKFLDKNGVNEVKIGNIKVGFLRSDIMLLRDKLESGKIKK